MIALGIAWKNPESTVSIVNGDSLGQLLEGVGSMMERYQQKGGKGVSGKEDGVEKEVEKGKVIDQDGELGKGGEDAATVRADGLVGEKGRTSGNVQNGAEKGKVGSTTSTA